MDLSVSPKHENWFLRVCHHISNAVYHHVQNSEILRSAHTVYLRALNGFQNYNLLPRRALTGFYHPDEECLLRGTGSMYKPMSLVSKRPTSTRIQRNP